jgi:hypothetical protein
MRERLGAAPAFPTPGVVPSAGRRAGKPQGDTRAVSKFDADTDVRARSVLFYQKAFEFFP